MEEYVEREEEAIQATQTKIEEEERVEAREEPEQPVQETRKRKRGAEEARTEHSKEKASGWVLNLAYVTLRDKLQHKYFICEKFSASRSPPSKKLL